MASVFALTRKKMGEIYGARKRVSAVALLELNGVDDLVGQVRFVSHPYMSTQQSC